MLYWAAKLLGLLFIRTKRVPVRLIGAENIPEKGPAIFAPRHEDNSDWAMVACFVKFPVYFTFKHDAGLVMRFIMSRLMKMVPVRRFGSSNRGAFQKAIDLLARGRGIGFFPEGTRGPVLKEARNGVGYLAALSGCPVIPVAITGTEGILRRLSVLVKALFHPLPPITVTFCEPVHPEDYGNDPRRITEEVMRRIAAELPKKERGYYSDKV